VQCAVCILQVVVEEEVDGPPFGDLKHAKTGRVDLVASGQGPRTLS
jgi:hypothetical protein